MDPELNIPKLADHLFRRESGKMVAVLGKIFGIEWLETAEDTVQQTFADAISIWTLKGIPDNPSAWLYRVAKNKAIDLIRKNKHTLKYDFADDEKILLNSEYTLSTVMENYWKEDLIRDDMLRMMFAACHPGISPESQIALILKTICGFSTGEIARALLCSEETISKRLYRAREFLRENKVRLVIPSVTELKSRVSAVLNTIYLLFNEGYNATKAPQLIRLDLMAEAMMLGKLLTENRHSQIPEAYALMALMCFHAARSESRLTREGEIILLPDQDRTKWDHALIELGNCYLSQSAFGNEMSPYHIEAAIAFEHCRASDFSATDWVRILELYGWLNNLSPSPITELNRVVAIMQVQGPANALEAMNQIIDKTKLDNFYLYHGLLGEIHARLSQPVKALVHLEKALKMTASEPERKILKHKINALMNPGVKVEVVKS